MRATSVHTLNQGTQPNFWTVGAYQLIYPNLRNYYIKNIRLNLYKLEKEDCSFYGLDIRKHQPKFDFVVLVLVSLH